MILSAYYEQSDMYIFYTKESPLSSLFILLRDPPHSYPTDARITERRFSLRVRLSRWSDTYSGTTHTRRFSSVSLSPPTRGQSSKSRWAFVQRGEPL